MDIIQLNSFKPTNEHTIVPRRIQFKQELKQELESLKRIFLIIGNKASTTEFNLNELPSSGGIMD